jgi:hypothetical protein
MFNLEFRLLLTCQVDALTTKRGKEGAWVVERVVNTVMSTSYICKMYKDFITNKLNYFLALFFIMLYINYN